MGGLFFAALFLFSGCGKTTVSSEPETAAGFALDTVISVTIYGGEEGLDRRPHFHVCDLMTAFFPEQKKTAIFTKSIMPAAPLWKSPKRPFRCLKPPSPTRNFPTALLTAPSPRSASLWNFQNDSGTLPDPETLAKAVSRGRLPYRRGERSDGYPEKNPKAALDLGGIAKGYIADRLQDFLTEKGVTGAVINLGGNVLTVGEKPDGGFWKIAIQKPFAEKGETLDAVSLKQGSVVTSGVYERYFYKDGILYHHLLDPSTGYPVENDLYAVTILSKHSVDGDALSTICFVLGYEKGAELIRSLNMPGLEAIFVFSDETMEKVSSTT